MLASNRNENLWKWEDFKRLLLKWEVTILALLKWRRKSLWWDWWLISGLFTHWNNLKLTEKLGKYVKGQVGKSTGQPHKALTSAVFPRQRSLCYMGWEKNSKSSALPLVPQCHTLRVSWDEPQQFGCKAELAGTNTFYQGAGLIKAGTNIFYHLPIAGSRRWFLHSEQTMLC